MKATPIPNLKLMLTSSDLGSRPERQCGPDLGHDLHERHAAVSGIRWNSRTGIEARLHFRRAILVIAETIPVPDSPPERFLRSRRACFRACKFLRTCATYQRCS